MNVDPPNVTTGLELGGRGWPGIGSGWRFGLLETTLSESRSVGHFEHYGFPPNDVLSFRIRHNPLSKARYLPKSTS